MSTKKYEFTGETKEHEGRTLRRIRRLSDGLVGGWIESESNLSHEGDCFVYDKAMIYDSAYISDNAHVYEYACVYDNAHIYNNAHVYGYARVCGNVRVYGNARVYGLARICGNALVYGNAHVCNDMYICENPFNSPTKSENSNSVDESFNISVNVVKTYSITKNNTVIELTLDEMKKIKEYDLR